jgi:6-phosphofructokinase 1
MQVATLGEARFPSPLSRVVNDQTRIPAHIARVPGVPPPEEELLFELAGPRPRLFFDPSLTCAGIVTCGGLCPGLNNVIRSLFLELHHIYGVKEVLGFRFGYRGLDPTRGAEPVRLTPEFVEDIHKEGGTVLGTSRGPVDIAVAVENLIRRGVNLLFTIGGDGTQRGAHKLYQEAQRRAHALSVVGIPKTIDNDVAFVSRTFGFQTAVEESCRVIDSAHTEVHSVQNGIAVVKLMGRQAGFIAAGAAVASQDTNFTLIPEVPFRLEGERGFLAALKKRVLTRAHAVIVVAEGAGQDLIPAGGEERDASGNMKLKDIGPFLRERIESYFKAEGIPVVMRYLDPSYLIRSRPADAEDSMLCDLLARNAAHAAMAGKTDLVIGSVHDVFVHVPIELLAREEKRVDPNGQWWHAVLASTGQPDRFA